MLNWISEQDKLPIVGQTVLLATPRQMGGFWDIETACILIRFEGVTPMPVPAGSERWPTEYYWGKPRGQNTSTSLVTGNGWWASLADIPLPPQAEHGAERGYEFVRQVGHVWIGQGEGHKKEQP